MINSTMTTTVPAEGKRPQGSADSDCTAAIAEFIRKKGVTRCPTACVLPTQGSVADTDRAALAAYAAAREQLRRVRAAARSQGFSTGQSAPPLGG